jgi:hypothetical protein
MGCEKEPRYVEVARERIEDFLAGQLKMRPLGQPVYEPSGREKVAQRPDEWPEQAL